MNSIINRKFRYTFSGASVAIIAANVIVYFVTAYLLPRLMVYLSLVPAAVIYGRMYWQFVTYMFVHAGAWHLFSNMLGLYIFGMAVEREIGTREFLLFYFLTGILSGAASFLTYVYTGSYLVMLMGASGALYAVMLLFSVLYPRAVIFVFGVIPVKAPVLVILYFLIELFSQMGSYGMGIAHLTHLYGLLFAFLYCLIRLRIGPWQAWGL